MSYKIKAGKLTKTAKPKVGDIVYVDYGITDRGWVWKCDARDAYGGPFATEAECRKHSTDTLLGPDCKITEGGQWDPAWERLQ